MQKKIRSFNFLGFILSLQGSIPSYILANSGEMELQFVGTKAMVAKQLTTNVGLQVLVAGKDLMGMFSG